MVGRKPGQKEALGRRPPAFACCNPIPKNVWRPASAPHLGPSPSPGSPAEPWERAAAPEGGGGWSLPTLSPSPGVGCEIQRAAPSLPAGEGPSPGLPAAFVFLCLKLWVVVVLRIYFCPLEK